MVFLDVIWLCGGLLLCVGFCGLFVGYFRCMLVMLVRFAFVVCGGCFLFIAAGIVM